MNIKLKFKIQNSKFKTVIQAAKLFVVLTLNLSFSTHTPAQNDLQKIPDGGFIEKWLISNEFPAEIDAGMWENFNRFNIENLPQKDWLKPFPKPQAGSFKSSNQTQQTPKAVDSNGNPLPEIGAASVTKIFPDAINIKWTEFVEKDAVIAFHLFHEGKQIGTSYAASYINSANEEVKFIETDGFLGSIWLNGEKIYDGYSLTLKKVAAAKFKKGENLLLVRATGISGDYWRKDGGWSALIRLWNDKTSAENSAKYKSINQAGTVFYLEGFHVDPVYLQDQKGYSKVTLSNMNQYVSSLKADKNYGVFFSEIDYLKPYLDTHPEDRDFLRQTVKDGRVGTGGAYNQFNENTIGGEAIIRNILYGQEMHKAMLGRKAESLALWDVFGHAPQISQIAQKSGFNGIVWSKKITGFQPFFLDYALDGSKLLHRRVDYAYSFSGFGSGKNYSFDNFLRMTENKFKETQSFGSSVDLRINAADFTPPWTNLAGNVERLNKNKPQIKTTGQAQDLYFQAVNKEIADGKVKPPISSRDKLFFHVGVNMARSDLKIGQRLAENVTLNSEKFGSIAYLLGAKYPDLALDKAWRQIFFGSHHDAITGTPSDSAFLDLVLGYREAIELSKGALADSLKFIVKQINTNSKFKIQNSTLIPIVVFNPMNWRRSDVVRTKIDNTNVVVKDDKGKVIAHRNLLNNQIEFVANDVPSIGYKTFYLSSESSLQAVTRSNQSTQPKGWTPNEIENEFYKITIDQNKGGAISGIYDKQAKREIINTSRGNYGNEIASLKEELTRKNVIYPAWEMWTTGEKKFSTEKPAKIISANNNEIILEGELPNMQKFRQKITLRTGIKRIDFKTELIDYKGYNELFTVNFPLNLTGGALVTEDRFGTVVRNGSKGFLDFRTNTDKLVSGSPVYSVNNWAEYGSVLNLNFIQDAETRRVGDTEKKAEESTTNGRTEKLNQQIAASPRPSVSASQIIASVPFKPSALIRPKGEDFEKATENLVANFIKRGVSITPFYDDFEAERRKNLPIEDSTMPKKLNDDIAYHNFRISLGDDKQNTYTAELFKLVSAETKAKFADRLAKDSFAYLFLYDKNVPEGWSAMPVLVMAGDVHKASENLVAPIGKGEFAINISAESFAVERNPNKDLPNVPNYGVALINNGTAGVSLENPNTLTLHLTHTAIFPGVNLPFEFVPENKTHVFTYSLYPHEKNWREADTVKVGYDFNNPLIAVQTDIHDGNLPSEKGFVEVRTTKENVVLTALKLGDNPDATFKSPLKNKPRPLIMRFNETKGVRSGGLLLTNFFKSERPIIDVLDVFEKVNLLEESIPNSEKGRRNWGSTNPFVVGVDNFGIETFKLSTVGMIGRDDSNFPSIGTTKELIQPVYSRYWLHNMGAAPLGNDAVKVSLRPVEQMGNLSTFAWEDPYNQGGITTMQVRVQVVNNYQDQTISGEVFLEVPEDWRVVPDKIAYEIEPNGSFVKDVAIIAFPVKKNLEFERASGLVKARIEHDGQVLQDVLNIGKPYKLEWRTEQTADSATIYIKNSYRQTIEGAVALITPPETWAGGIYSTEPLFPREQGFSVPPNSEIAVKFAHGILPEGSWRIARIAYNGNIDYKRADGKTK
jgi:alpha-mannosidase